MNSKVRKLIVETLKDFGYTTIPNWYISDDKDAIILNAYHKDGRHCSEFYFVIEDSKIVVAHMNILSSICVHDYHDIMFWFN